MDPYDLATLLAHREALGRLDPSGPPSMALLGPTPSCRTVALLPGSFNPPTAAHLMLAERALRDRFDCVVFLLARTSAGKEQTGLLPEDRLLAVRTLCQQEPLRVGIASHPLYADQAEAASRLFPGAAITFLVGSDKVLQIFDPVWYEDREAALERLFSRAALWVAPRSDHGEALRACLEDPANERWTSRITVLRLHPAVSDLSSTHVRGMLRAGAEPGGLVPPPVASFLAAVRAFAPPVVVGSESVDPYAARAQLLDLLWRPHGELAVAVDLRALTELALAETPDGKLIRAALRGEERADEVLARVAGDA